MEDDSRGVTRRQLLSQAGVAGAGVVAGGALGLGAVLTRVLPASGQTQTLTAYPQKRIANLRTLQQGKPVQFEYPLAGQFNYLVKLGVPALDGVGSGRDVVAFSTTCVHMGCPLVNTYNGTHRVLGPCPCHLSTYDLTVGGMPVTGAATEDLPQIALSVDDKGDIYAFGVWGVIYGYANNLQPRQA